MDSLISLVASFKPEERHVFKEFYGLTVNRKKQKRFELLKLIVNERALTNERACQQLYNKEKDSAFTHLKRGLREDLLHMLHMFPVTSFIQLPVNVALADCRKMISQAHYLFSRNNPKESFALLNKARKLALKYEHYSELLSIYNILITYNYHSNKLSEYKKIAEARRKCLEMERIIERARHIEMLILLPPAEHYWVDDKYIEERKKLLTELTQLHEVYDSSRVASSYFRGKMFYNKSIFNYEASRKAAEEMADYIKNDNILNSKNNKGGLQLQMSTYSMHLMEFDKAEESADSAFQFFAKKPSNQIRALRLKFLANLHMRKYDKAAQIVDAAMRHKGIDSAGVHIELWHFYKATILFRLKNFNESMRLLQMHTNLKEDKAGWYLGTRFLDLICQLEVGNYHIFEIKLKALRRLLSSLKSKVSARDQQIYNAFRALLKSRFDYTAAIDTNVQLFTVLHNGSKGNEWDPTGYELIRVDQWMIEKSRSKIFV